MRPLLLLIPCVLLAVAVPRFLTETPLPAVVKTSHPGGRGSASATPLWDANGFAWYLTCKHCLPVATVGGQQVLCAFPHPTRDLALLQVKGSVGVGSRLGAQPEFGDELRTIGYAMGQSKRMTAGYAGAQLGIMTCPIIHGCSGGAVLDEGGRLVGLMWRFWSTNWAPIPHISEYVLVYDLKSWLLARTGV